MNSDSTTTIDKLKQLLKDFRDERDWKKFHDPKNLAVAICIEASELLELFLWKGPAQVKKSIKSDAAFRKAVEEELADVLCFCLSLANVAEIDVARTVQEKIEGNKRKYPIEKARGRATKYDRL
ncbi:MAG TPA: nucleotide pyrophosphohydrolase [Terriglobales bacterium]